MNIYGIIFVSILGLICIYIITKIILDVIWNQRLNRFLRNEGVTHLNKTLRVVSVRRTMIALTAVVVLVAVVATDVFKLPEVFNDKTLVNASKAGSYSNLKSKMNEKNGFYIGGWFNVLPGANLEDAAIDEGPETRDVVGTNVQIEGVDEADIIKTDGFEVFYSPSYHRNEIFKFSVNVDGSLEQQQGILFDDYYVQELYLTDELLVVIGYTYEDIHVYYDEFLDALIMPSLYWSYRQYTGNIRIFDRVSLQQKYELQTDGSIQAHRLIDDMFYMISYTQVTENDLRPEFIETINDVKHTSYVGYDDILFFDQVPAYQMMTVTSLNVKTYDMHSESVVGVSSIMYMTKDAIYTAGSYSYYPFLNTVISGTHIIKFGISEVDGSIHYNASTTLEGYIENQFWMDAYDGFFRVVTSRGWNQTDKNRLYVLKENDETDTFDQVGLLDEGIGKPLERVTSVRFIENEVFIVTFRNIDPLYTINLSNPVLPVITNEIEEEGYNTYLHSWGDNQAIGIGYDGSFNVKISAYNTLDKSEPLDTYFVSDPGDDGYDWSYSEALNNHKAILVSPEKGFIGFAVNRSYYNQAIEKYEYTSYFLIFYIDFNQEEEIISDPIQIAHDVSFYENQVERGIYIDEIFYTFSSNSIISFDSQTKTIIDEYLIISQNS